MGRMVLGRNKGGWLDPELCAKARREEVEYIRRHKMYTRFAREVCLHETVEAPIKTGWAETDKGQPGKPNVRARWVAKEYETHVRPELYASTPPLEALKVVLSEIAMGELGGKVVALVDGRRAYFYAPARRRVFVELPPEEVQPVQHAWRRTTSGAGAGIDTQRSQIDERAHQARAPCGNCARRRHHNRREHGRWWNSSSY